MFSLGNSKEDSSALEKPYRKGNPSSHCRPYSKHLRSTSCMPDAGLVSRMHLSACFVSSYLRGRGEQKTK